MEDARGSVACYVQLHLFSRTDLLIGYDPDNPLLRLSIDQLPCRPLIAPAAVCSCVAEVTLISARVQVRTTAKYVTITAHAVCLFVTTAIPTFLIKVFVSLSLRVILSLLSYV